MKTLLSEKTFFLLLLPLVMLTKTYACDCAYQGNFLKVAPTTNLVALVKIKKFINSTTMEVEIIEVLKGSEKRERIIVWGDDGNDCLPYISEFKKDKEYLIAFNNHTGKDLNKEYEISICGEYWLNIEKRNNLRTTISSNNEKQKRIDYNEIKRIFKSKEYRK